jgi:hypothetical protein
LPKVGLQERGDLQQMIRNSPDIFFEEMGEKLLLLAEEARPSDFVADRTDLLALDEDGAVVVIELKRGSNKLHLLQALSYASMIAKWNLDKIVSLRSAFSGATPEDAQDEIERFLGVDITSVNQQQRLILIGEEFEYEVLSTAEWLWERHEVDIRCFRMGLTIDGQSEYLSCACIYPPREIAQHALAADFRHINPAQARVILLEGSARVLPPYVPELSEKARKQLVRLGVDVRTGQSVTAIDAEGVEVGGTRIPTRTVLWAAGVAAAVAAAWFARPLAGLAALARRASTGTNSLL